MKAARLTLIIFALCIGICASAQSRKIRVACVGDSVTYGYGLDNPDKESYPSVLQALLGDSYEVHNYGFSGATLLAKAYRPYIKQDVFGKSLDCKADIVVIHLGLNDTDPRAWPQYRDYFLQDYLSLIDTYRKANPKAEVFVCKMTPIFHYHKRFKSGTRDWYWMEQELIESLQEIANVRLIDLYTPLHHRPDLFADALHPDKEGAEIIAHTVYQALTGDFGGLQMPPYYSNGMILQRGDNVSIAGRADAEERVTVEVGDFRSSVIADDYGRWKIEIPSGHFPKGGFDIRIFTQARQLTYRNVLLGDIWICSGQSNMAFKAESVSSNEIHKYIDYAESNGGKVRIFDMKPKWETSNTNWNPDAFDALNRLEYFHPSEWKQLDSDNFSNLSAIALSFAEHVEKETGTPIGLIINAVGGSPAESWIGRRTLEFDFPDILYDWRNNDFIQGWVRKRASVNIAKAANPHQRHPFEPAYLFESCIEPLKGLNVKGVIWYQGESNAHNIEAFERLFPILVGSWREVLGKNLPFHFVQLSSINRPSWPHFRDCQRRLSSEIENVTMTVSSDLGDSLDVHPRHKYEIGRRLALQALAHTYGYDLVASGPEVISARLDGDSIVLEFKKGEVLMSAEAYISRACEHTDNKANVSSSKLGKHSKKMKDGSGKLRSFEIASHNGLYYEAEVEVHGNTIRLSHPQVKSPAYVRYGWQPYSKGNLVNRYGLPASTFKISGL